jgi:hypothetical protein
MKKQSKSNFHHFLSISFYFNVKFKWQNGGDFVSIFQYEIKNKEIKKH